MTPIYRRYRSLLFRLVRTLRFESTTQDRLLLDALLFVLSQEDRRAEWASAGKLSLGFAEPRWRKFVLRTRDGETEFHRRHLELCVFSHLAADLKAGDVAVVGSEQYADYRGQLLPWAECEPLIAEYCQKLGLAPTAKGFAEQLRQELTAVAEQTDRAYPDNAALRITKQGEPVLTRVPKRPVPDSARELEALVQLHMPERNVLDALWLTEQEVHFTRHFGPLSGSNPKLEQARERYCLGVFTEGSGLGPYQAAKHMAGSVTPHVLSNINRRHITAEKLEAATREVINRYAQFELIRLWGSGQTASFDGTLFELAEQNLLADYHFRYGQKGAVAFHVVSDTYMALFTHFIPPGVWEAVYIIEALLKNKSDLQPSSVFADTQGQSTPVFAFTHLLGIKLIRAFATGKTYVFINHRRKAATNTSIRSSARRLTGS